MSMKDALAAAAKKSKQKTIQGSTSAPVEKVPNASKSDFAAALGAARAKSTQALGEIDVKFDVGVVPTWSFSTLSNFERCPWSVKLGKVDGVPDESGPAAERGSSIHDQIEQWVRGEAKDLPHDNRTKFDVFTQDFHELRRNFVAGKVQMEEKWGIRKDWSPCEWDDEGIWGKAMLDAFFLDDRDPENVSCMIIDYKTGQSFKKEMVHSDQGLNYALHAYHRYPEIQVFVVEFWYIDQGTKMKRQFNRQMLKEYILRYHARAQKMTSTTFFMPKANLFSCQYCSFGSNKSRDGRAYGNGACGHDVYKELEEI